MKMTRQVLGPTTTVHMDVSEARRAMTFLQRQQMPFIVAATLTRTITGGQTLMRNRVKRLYKLHTPFIPQQFKRRTARKEEIISTGSTEARLYTDRKIKFMIPHETGEYKMPIGAALTNPDDEAVKLPGFKTGTGKVSTRFQPKNLLRPTFSVKSKRRVGGAGKRQPTAFVLRGAIVRRATDRKGDRNNLVTLFRFIPRAKIKPTLQMEETMTKFVRTALPVVYRRVSRAAFADPRGPK